MKAGFGVADSGLDAAYPRCDIYQLGIELAPILPNRGDVRLQLLLQFGRALLLCARIFELLLVTLDLFGREFRGRLCGRSRDLAMRRICCSGTAGPGQYQAKQNADSGQPAAACGVSVQTDVVR